MIEAAVTAMQMKNHFGKYLDMVIRGNEVIIRIVMRYQVSSIKVYTPAEILLEYYMKI